jgi:hypothetical protein
MCGQTIVLSRRARDLLALFSATVLVCQARASASSIWDGGGGSNRWSDRFNWSDDQLPSGTGTLTFPAHAGGWTTTQDLFSSSSGIANSSFSRIDFIGGGTIYSGSAGSALGIADNGRISGGPLIDVPLVTSGALRVDVPTSTGLSISSIVQQPGAITDLHFGADASHAGQVILYDPSYSGSTTLDHGTLYLGVLGFHVNTRDQGDYTIAAGASLFVNGTLGLAGNHRVDNSGTIGMSGDGPDPSLNIVGDLRMASGSTWLPDVTLDNNLHPASYPIDVTGALDLSAASDTMRFVGLPTFPAGASSYVLANYGSRLGEFDTILGLRPGMSIVYTSATNAGSGQIVLQVPEPTTALIVLGPTMMLRRPRCPAGRRVLNV